MNNKPLMYIIFELTQTSDGVEAFTWMSPDFKILAPDAKGKVLTVHHGETHNFHVYAPKYATDKVRSAVATYAEQIIKEQTAINAKRRPVNR